MPQAERISADDAFKEFRPFDPSQLPPEAETEEYREEYEGAPDPPQPQRFVLQLPSDLATASCWTVVQPTMEDPEKKPDPADASKILRVPSLHAFRDDNGKRAVLCFDNTTVLTIVGQARGGPGGRSYVGEALHTRISNVERNRARKTENPILVPAMLDLIRALYAEEVAANSIVLPRRGDNARAMELLRAKAGAIFTADWEWSGYCNPKRVAQVLVEGEIRDWVDPGTGAQIMGCGKRIYQKDWPRGADGFYQPRANCQNPDPKLNHQWAVLRAFGELRRFKPAK
jgi:hypothetical protein